MKNQNKILMSLLTASISALAAAPALASDSKDKKIDINSILNSDNLNAEQAIEKQDIKNQINAMLAKKAPIMKISESINIVIENYSNGSSTIKQQVFDDLNLGVYGVQDSTNIVVGGTTGTVGGATTACHAVCHTACHGVCHGACHGARGWR